MKAGHRKTGHRGSRFTTALATVALASATSLVALSTPTIASGAVAGSTYVVLYHQGASTTDARATVEAAGGTLVANYSQIGVVIARSDNAAFAAVVKANPKVEGAASTAGLGTRVAGDVSGTAAEANTTTSVQTAATWGDSLSGLQWDMAQIHAPEAQAINPGSPSVVVGDVDTGLDFTHPDLAPNYDAANSVDCSGGTPAPLAVGNDRNGHGTHTAGTIAAAANGTGIVGVAPGVRIAGIKSSNDDGFFFPEMVICSYMWIASHPIDLTNNSYFADPWLFNCKNDPGQRAIWKAERRAIALAQSRGTTVLAAEGNESTDLSHPTVDLISPDNATPIAREITNACAVIPVEIPGVVGVTATGNLGLKSFYSSYGVSAADVAAPGGDSLLQRTAAAPNGRVLSTWPNGPSCRRLVVDPATGARYCYLQGTSMANPHATGVAALALSARRGTAGSLAAAVQRATNPLPCPTDMSIYGPFPQNSGAPQVCQGGAGHNSFYGSGEVDALKAVQ